MSARGAWLAAVLGLAACRGNFMPPVDYEPRLADRPFLGERRAVHPSGALRYVRQVRVFPDGATVRHGLEREYAENGTLVAERAYREGEPIGRWRYWYPSGAPRAELVFGGPGAPGPMTWWHENGRISAEGLARGGVREGRWTWYHDNGQVSEEGELCAGLRDGPWRTWYADGRPHSEGRYAAGLRVGEWTEWDERGVPHRIGALGPVAIEAAAPRAP